MKAQNIKLLFFLPILLLTMPAVAEGINILDAAEKRHVLPTIKGNGNSGYNALTIHLKNLTNQTITVQVPAGLALNSMAEHEQDMVVVQPLMVQLKPYGKDSVRLTAFCTQSSNGAPGQGSRYGIIGMANEHMQKLVNFLSQNNAIETGGQSAVWCLSNGHNIADIYFDDPKINLACRELVAAATGQKLPWYTRHYQPQENPLEYVDTVREIAGEFNYILPKYALTTFGIYKQDGTLVQLFFSDKANNKGKYIFSFSLEANYLKKGTYLARMYADNKLVEEKEIVI